MATFHYLPPAPEVQTAFLRQLAGTLAGLLLIAGCWFWLAPAARPLLAGAAAAALWLAARSAWELEQQARRARQTSLEVDADGLRLHRSGKEAETILWSQITSCEVIGGRLQLSWPGRQLQIGAREVENGMELIRQVSRYCHPPSPAAGNFIPLTPRLQTDETPPPEAPI